LVLLETPSDSVGCETDDGFGPDVEELLFDEAISCLDWREFSWVQM
jgi:hypothetical protein